ncbi:two-partner secretion domain-containing protein [Phormidium sp. CCY1219]|uniref:two-partner secretion domain-containing protein n=1 Tax=Phormidium sp. CCY1219 TaxID=2886104 RepID=UPI002D1F8285|nr:filamentous hemagglutinin N-terminal domain-containing protein [Phormidium sp. CCY1219]MEB3828526.1 filamentous hemagglutinin N-terminal domain-containing protein [Phormidium sp. CCY1219]
MSLSWGLLSKAAIGQIVPDATLPVNSIVTPEGQTRVITGGTEAGGNLFHSFREFNVPTGGVAYFDNAPAIHNIFTRITGGTRSQIDGLLQTNGTANLFLLNPAGIIFGPHARLNVGGSFFASSAEAIAFADRTQFSATPRDTPPLLTISVPLGLQLGPNPESVAVNGAILQVPPGETLSFVGADIAIAHSELNAPGGQIRLHSLGEGFSPLSPTTATPPQPTHFHPITLANTTVNASGEGGGDIQLQGSRISLRDNSTIVADTLGSQPGIGIEIRAQKLQLRDRSFISASTLGSGTGGNLAIRATDSLEILGGGSYQEILDNLFQNNVTTPAEIASGIFALSFATGKAGTLRVETPTLAMSNGAYISTATFGRGTGGTLNVRANRITLSASQLFADNFGNGDAGNVTVSADSLRVVEGGAIAASTFGEGRGGTVNITASDSLELIGTTPNNRFNSGIFASAYSEATKPAGNLNLTTGRLSLRQGASVGAATFGAAPGGTLNIRAERVEVSGTSTNGEHYSRLDTASHGAGTAGDLRIDTGTLMVRDSGLILTASFGTGAGGNLTIRASESVELIGTDTFDLVREVEAGTFDPTKVRDGLFTATSGPGNAGSLTIETRHFSARNQANVSTSTLTEGDGGNLMLRAEDKVELNNSFLVTGTAGIGAAGGLMLETNRLLLGDNAAIATSTLGAGPGGDLTITASESVDLSDGSILLTTSDSTGNAGSLTITTGDLRLTNNAEIATASVGQGNGGNLQITASESVELRDGSGLLTSTFGMGDAGWLAIQTDRLSVTNESGIVTSTWAEGSGGNLAIAASESVELTNASAFLTETFDSGPAGDLNITARSLTLNDGTITVSSQASGEAGNLHIATDLLYLVNGELLAATASGQGGNIELQVGNRIGMRQNSRISAEAIGTGNGGNITINTDLIGLLESSKIRANAVQGQGGNIQIDTRGLLSRPGQITASSQQGIDGVVRVDTPEIDPSHGLIPLPTEVVDTLGWVFSSCGPESDSSFYVTGRGGLPPSPNDPLSTHSPLVDLGFASFRGLAGDRRRRSSQRSQLRSPPTPPLVEAQGWVVNGNGDIQLTAEVPHPTPHSPWHGNRVCLPQIKPSVKS